MLDEDELLGDVLPATPVVPNVLYTIGASSEDETATVGARSNEGTFIGTLTVQAREFMWSVQRPSGSRRRLPPVVDGRPGKKSDEL